MKLLAWAASAAAVASAVTLHSADPPTEPDDNLRLGLAGSSTADLLKACESPSDGTEVLMDVIKKAVKGNYSEDAVGDFLSYEAAVVEQFQTEYPKLQAESEERRSKQLKVLVLLAVANSAPAVKNFGDNLAVLRQNKFNDVFEYAIFHHDLDTSRWDAQPDYAKEGGAVVKKHLGAGCKPHFWHLIQPDVAAKYDYLWILDEDIRFDFFSWDTYRTVLLMLDPLVSQPAIIPQAFGKKGTGVTSLNMKGPQGDHFPVAFESPRSEQQAVLIHSRVWASVHARNAGNDRSSDWFIDDFWDTLAYMAKRWCGKAGMLVINACPVRHMNCHNLLARNHLEGEAKCKYGCGAGGANCRNVSQAEIGLIRQDMRGYCDDLPGDLSMMTQGDMHQVHGDMGLYAGGKKTWRVPIGH